MKSRKSSACSIMLTVRVRTSWFGLAGAGSRRVVIVIWSRHIFTDRGIWLSIGCPIGGPNCISPALAGEPIPA